MADLVIKKRTIAQVERERADWEAKFHALEHEWEDAPPHAPISKATTPPINELLNFEEIQNLRIMRALGKHVGKPILLEERSGDSGKGLYGHYGIWLGNEYDLNKCVPEVIIDNSGTYVLVFRMPK